jgi:hypothetical protein
MWGQPPSAIRRAKPGNPSGQDCFFSKAPCNSSGAVDFTLISVAASASDFDIHIEAQLARKGNW